MADIKVMANITNFSNPCGGLGSFTIAITTNGIVNSSTLQIQDIDVDNNTEFEIYNILKNQITAWVAANAYGDTTTPNSIKLFGVYVNQHSITSPTSKFVFTGSETLDTSANYDICGLYKKRILAKGELKEIEYYKVLDLQTLAYSSLAVKEYRHYTRDAFTGLVQYRTMNIDWYLEDGTIGYAKSNIIKVYSFNESREESQTRRANIINDAESYLLFQQINTYGQSTGFMNALGFLSSIKLPKDLYVDGNGQPIVDAINNSTIPFITADVKTTLLNILNYDYTKSD